MFGVIGNNGAVRAYRGLDGKRTLQPGTMVKIIGYIPDDEGGEVLFETATGYTGRVHRWDLSTILN